MVIIQFSGLNLLMELVFGNPMDTEKRGCFSFSLALRNRIALCKSL